jgi:hypothetical protein
MFNSCVSLFVGSHGLPAESGTLMDISKFDAALFWLVFVKMFTINSLNFELSFSVA